LSTITAGGRTYTIAVSQLPSATAPLVTIPAAATASVVASGSASVVASGTTSTAKWSNSLVMATGSPTALGPAQYTGAAGRSFVAVGAALGGVAAFAALL